MSIFKRISNVVRSNVNSALDAAEDPRKVLEQTIMDMEGEHKKARQKLLEAMTLLKQAEKQHEGYKKSAADWEGKAMAALKAGSEDLARQALTEKGKVDNLLIESEAGVSTQKAANEQLKEQIVGLERKIDEARSKKDELIARLNAAEMKKKQAAASANPGGSAVGDSSAFDTFDRMVNKIENTEAEVEARSELMGDNNPAVDLELSKLAKAQQGEDALAALKAKMAASGTPAPASTPPAPAAGEEPPANAIDDELEKLKAKLGG